MLATSRGMDLTHIAMQMPIKQVKLDLLFLVITHMPCLYPHQVFIIYWLIFIHYPLIHEYQYCEVLKYNYHGQV